MKKKTSFRLSEIAAILLALLAERDGITMTAEIELAIRERAERRGVSAEAREKVE